MKSNFEKMQLEQRLSGQQVKQLNESDTASNITKSESPERALDPKSNIIPNDPEAMRAYSEFCQHRYNQLLKQVPSLAQDKEKLASIIA